MSVVNQAATLEQYITDHLDEALEKNYIKPYFQPVIRTFSRQLCGLEALARWEDPIHGVLSPGSFIDTLERRRRIHEVDISIIRQVCALYQEAVMGSGVLLPISVNLSRLDYELCDIFAVLKEAAETNRMPRNRLCIEITESALNENGALIRQHIDRFRSAGYQVWMDDFGIWPGYGMGTFTKSSSIFWGASCKNCRRLITSFFITARKRWRIVRRFGCRTHLNPPAAARRCARKCTTSTMGGTWN